MNSWFIIDVYKRQTECIERLGGVEKPAKCFAIVVEALERNPDQDFLGRLYMSLELGNHWKGQFFTPYDVCRCMAEITIQDNIQNLQKDVYKRQGEKMGNSGVDFCGISEENFDRLKKGLVNMFPVIKVTEVKA